ncbi:MAG TPA: hypothetical protein VLB12_00100 [Gemmatimonadales bacterium]|nr:hypothetical protein [Gemmatimonadales bacterium]
MSQANGRKHPQLLSPFWPLEDQHGVGHVELDGVPPSNSDEVLPLLLRLAAQSDAMRSLQTDEAEVLSESAASVLRGEMAETMGELAELIDPASAEILRLRAKGLAGGVDHREMTLQIARSGPPPAFEIVCGPMCTWRMKTRVGLHSFLAATRDEPQQELLDQLDDSLEDALGEVEAEIGSEGMYVPFKLPMNVTDLLLSAGEAAGHPKHFAYFMPEDEGVDGLPLEEQRTLYMRNVHLARYREITIPLAEALLRGPMQATDVPIEDTLMPWIRGHDHGHNVIVPSTSYDEWRDDLGIEPFMALQEAIADVYGFLMTISDAWSSSTGVSRLDMCATHMAELLHYMRRGPKYYGDPGAAFVELSFLAENGFVEIDDRGRVRWEEEGFSRGMAALGSALTDATVGAPDERGSEAFLARYGWPTETAAMPTFEAMREELANVPTSIAFYRTSDVTAAEPAAVPA